MEVVEALLGEAGAEEANLLYGCKVRINDQDGWIPRSAAITEGFTPVAGDVWGTEPVATYAFGWELPDAWRFDTSIRYACADGEEGRFDRWMPSVVLRIPVTDRWEVHAAWFGSWSQGLADDSVRPFAGPGTHFMITRDSRSAAAWAGASPVMRRATSSIPVLAGGFVRLLPGEVVVVLDVEEHLGAEPAGDVAVDDGVVGGGVAAHEVHRLPVSRPSSESSGSQARCRISRGSPSQRLIASFE